MMCSKCKKMTGGLLVLFGVLFLLQDVGVWAFWNINWWTVLFLVGGLCALATCHCPTCQACEAAISGSKKSKKRR